MPEQTKINFRDNHGTIQIINRPGRPTNRPHESLSDPISVRLYSDLIEWIKQTMFDSGLSRNEIILRCIVHGKAHWNVLDWEENNLDHIEHMASSYHRKNGGDKVR